MQFDRIQTSILHLSDYSHRFKITRFLLFHFQFVCSLDQESLNVCNVYLLLLLKF